MKSNCALLFIYLIAALRAHAATIIEFASTNALSDEFAGTAKVSIVRQGSTASADTVTFSTADGTAKAGEEYLAVSNLVTFASGETNKVVEIPLKDDYFAEPDKTVVLRLTNLPIGVTSTRNHATFVIRDDDRPGSIDHAWSSALGLPPLGPNEVKYADPHIVSQQPDGKLIVDVWVYDRDFLYLLFWHLVRINPDGSVDSTYPIQDSFPSTPGGHGLDRHVAVMPDGGLLVWDSESTGTTFLGYRLRYRLSADGTKDETFPSISCNNGGGFDMIPQPDGKILVNTSDPANPILLDGQVMPRLFRLNNDGRPDAAFKAPENMTGAIRLLDNGQLLLEGLGASNLYRLNNDGSLDPSFASPANLSLSILKLLPDGKIFATAFASQSVKLYRLNQNGSLDNGFNVGTAVGNPVLIGEVIAQADGKFVIGGVFRTFNGQVRNSIVRLNSVGSIDPSFQTGQGFLGVPGGTTNDLGQPYNLWPLSGGRILVGGEYAYFNAASVTPPIVLNSDGSREPTFEGTLTDALGEILHVYLEGVIAGKAYFASGYGLGRLNLDLSPRIVSTARDSNGVMHLASNTLATRSYTLQASEDLTNWSDLTTQSATTNRLDFTDAPTPPPAKRFYRLKQD